MSKIDMESRGDGQMENIQHMAGVGCVIAGKVGLFSENAQVLARAHLDLLLTMFSTSESLSLFFYPHVLFLSLFSKEETYIWL